ncbi:MAG: hypothetical protein Q8R35_00985 [bacterium]|nr:hypothetical protein [bacterium]
MYDFTPPAVVVAAGLGRARWHHTVGYGPIVQAIAVGRVAVTPANVENCLAGIGVRLAPRAVRPAKRWRIRQDFHGMTLPRKRAPPWNK